jgi:hypothetical protein
MFFKDGVAHILKKSVFSVFYKLFLLFGRTTRFKLALRLARWSEPLIKASGYYPMPAFASGNYREFLTAGILQSMTNHGVEFDPVIEVRGGELIPQDGAIFLSGHFYLSFVFFRWLHDRNTPHSVFLVTGTDEWRILGTKTELQRLGRGNVSLVRVRRLLSDGELVIAAIDDCNYHAKWTKLDIPEREVYISEALIKFAHRSDTPIFFFDTYFEGKYGIATDIFHVSLTSRADTVDEFTCFLSNALEKRKKAA